MVLKSNERDDNDTLRRVLRTTGVAVLAAAVAGTVAALVVRDQITRHRRNLFSPYAFRRLAALAHVSRADATVDNITLLRDYIAWESRKLLRDRARGILERMEDEALARSVEVREPAV